MADDFDLWELIAAPISAMNEAEAGAAGRFVELLLDYAIEPPKAVDPSKRSSIEAAAQPTATATPAKLREVSFETRRLNTQGQIETRRITLPLLQLMPIGGVSINEATLTYGFSMRAARGSSPGARTLPGQPAKTAVAPRFTGRLAQTGGVRSSESSPATDANITIVMHLKQMDLPQGVLDLLQHTQGAVDEPKIENGVTAENGSAPVNDRLFTAEILGMSGKIIQPGEKFVLKIRITPHGRLSKPLHLSLTSQPGKALNIVDPPAEFDIALPKDVDLVVFVNSVVKNYKPSTKIAVVIHGTSADQDGSPVELTISLELPRN